MEKPPSLTLAHPKSAAERFLTEMLQMSQWDHLFRVAGVNYPIMPKDFWFVPQETIVSKGKQMEDDEMQVLFFARYSATKSSTIIVGMKREKDKGMEIWVPNSLSFDLYIRCERTRNIWGAERYASPARRIVPQAK